MRIFKVGDKVKFSEKMNGVFHNPVVEKDNESRKIIDTLFGSFILEGLPNNNFSPDELISVKFEKCDLQNGDILIDGAGDKSIYRNGELYGDTVDLDYLNNNLTADHVTYNESADIVKVERPVKFETVFERNEEVKEMTMEELCKHFGCQVKIVKEEE